MSLQFKSLALFLVLIPFLGGCTSFGKGIVRGLLEKSEMEDTRACQIWSKGFSGIDVNIDRKEGKTKVLMVHGVGHHLPVDHPVREVSQGT